MMTTLPEVPVFLKLLYSDLDPAFQKWLAEDHGRKPVRTKAGTNSRRNPRQRMGQN